MVNNYLAPPDFSSKLHTCNLPVVDFTWVFQTKKYIFVPYIPFVDSMNTDNFLQGIFNMFIVQSSALHQSLKRVDKYYFLYTTLYKNIVHIILGSQGNTLLSNEMVAIIFSNS